MQGRGREETHRNRIGIPHACSDTCRLRVRDRPPHGRKYRPAVTVVSQRNGAERAGNAANARGSAFNENGGIAGGVYAGNGENTGTPANGHAVSQYDVACFQASQH
jgi:hypothetical protein